MTRKASTKARPIPTFASVAEEAAIRDTHSLADHWYPAETEAAMATTIEIPTELARFELPEAVHARLQLLLDRQDGGDRLTPEEHREAEGLVDLAEFLSLLRLRSHRVSSTG
jgi:hypothetical protein